MLTLIIIPFSDSQLHITTQQKWVKKVDYESFMVNLTVSQISHWFMITNKKKNEKIEEEENEII